MKTNFKIILSMVIVVFLIILVVSQPSKQDNSNPSIPVSVATSTDPNPIASVTYSCDVGKTISASFYSGTPAAAVIPGQPPVPSGSVVLKLSDGRAITIPQTISADGSRYSNTDESFVFWSKGNGAFIVENSKDNTYTNCTEGMTATTEPASVSSYSNNKYGFEIAYPSTYAVDESYAYQALGPGKDIHGVRFTVPASLVKGTNLSSDTYISVEQLPASKSCLANLFLGEGVKATNLSEGTTTYSVASSSGAAAGNRYDETVYSLPKAKTCIAVRYFIHNGVYENYPEGTIKKFDKQALLNQFDQIRRSLVIN